MHYGDDLNRVILDPVRHDVWRPGNDEFAGARHSAQTTDFRKFPQALDSDPNSLDKSRGGCGILGRDPLVNVLQSSAITTWIYEAMRSHRGLVSRLYSSSASSS